MRSRRRETGFRRVYTRHFLPYVAVKLALPSLLALSMKPTIAPLAFSSASILSTYKA